MKNTFLFFLFVLVFSLRILAQTQPGSGKSLNFNGYSNYINCSANNRGITNKFTVEAWIKTTDSKLQMICTKYNNPADHGFQLLVTGGKAGLYGRDGNALYKSSGLSTTSVNDGKWHHIAGVYNITRWEIWVDGVLENSATYSNTISDMSNTAPFSIGNYQLVNDHFFNGEIDEVRLWNTARTGQEIKDNMCRKLDVTSQGLVGYYKLDEGTGTTTADHSVSNIPGNFINMPLVYWKVSGAPIGDFSKYFYQSTTGQNGKVHLALSNNDSLTVNYNSNITSASKGIHVYRVYSAPNSTSGIANPGAVSSYFGVFTAGSVTVTDSYSLFIKPSSITCNSDSMVLYKRPDNSAITWQPNTTTLNANNTAFDKPNEVYRSEYIPVINDAQAKVQINGNLNTCFGTPTTLTASTSSSYLWNNGQTTQTISPTTSGKYYVTAVNSLGCITSDTVFVTITPPLNVNAGNDVAICSGASATLGTTAIPGYSYSWSPAVGLSSTTVANPTVSFPNNTNLPISQTYILTATFNGCTATDQVTVIVNPKPVAVPGIGRFVCSGEPTIIGSAPQPGLTYSWTPTTGLSNPNIANPTATLINPSSVSNLDQTYTLTVTNSYGCVASGTVLLTVLQAVIANAGPDVSICNNSNVVLGTSPVGGGIYSWSPTTGLSNPNFANPTVTLPNPTGVPISQTYTVTTTFLSCTTTDQVVVTVNPSPALPSGAGIGHQACPNEPIVIGAAPVAGNTYSWSPGTGLSSTTVSNPTVILPNTSTSAVATLVYTLTVMNLNGCIATGLFPVNVQPMTIVDAGIDKTICSDESTTIGSNAEANHTYFWSPAIGLTNPNISNPTVTLINNTASPITQVYTLTSTRGSCIATDQVIVTVNPLPIADAGTDKIICSTQSIGIGTLPVAGNIYSWTPTIGLSNAAVSNPTATLVNNSNLPIIQTYILTVTNGFGCIQKDTVKVTINPLPISNAGNDITICSGSATSLGTGPTPGYTYSWSPAIGLSGTNNANPVVVLVNNSAVPISQTYTVTSTYYNCTTSDQVTVTVQPAVLVNAGIDKTICGGNSVIVGTNALPGYTYSWDPNPGLSSLTSATPVYTGTNNTSSPITVNLFLRATSTITNCSALDQVIITVNPKPVVDSIIGSYSVCPGVLGVDYHIRNPRLTAYQWIVEGGTIASGQGTTAITVNWGPSGPGKVKTYTLNSFSCSSDTVLFPVIINPLLITQKPAGPRQLCFYEAKNIYYQPPVVTNGSYYTYQVFGGTITSPNPSNSGISVNWHAPGKGKIIVTETSTTNMAFCFGVSDTLSVTINPSPDTTLAIIGKASACAYSQNHTYSLAGSSGSTYLWQLNGTTLSGNSNTINVNLQAAGNYILTALETNSFGCPGRKISKTITATPLPGTLTINGPTIICPDNQNNLQYSVSGLPGSTYNWKVTGGTITSGNGSNGIYVDFDNTRDKTIEVVETSSGNCVGSRFDLTAKYDGSIPQLDVVSTVEGNYRDIEISFHILKATVNTQPIDIYRREIGAGNSFQKIASIPNSQQKFTDPGLFTDQKIYEYRLESMNECGTQIRKTLQHNAVRLIATADENTKAAVLTWNTYKGWGINGVSRYEIYGKADNGSYAKVLEVNGNDSVATLANIAPKGFDQCFRLKATSNSGLISWSNESCITFENNLVIYNIVTANSDGKNDNFTVENIHLYPGNKLTIFNRWGVEVYKRKDYLNDWSGNGISDGTYYYLLKLKDGRSYKGWFDIVR